MKFLDGKKTYVIAALMFVVGGLRALDVIDENSYQMAMSALVPGGLISLRMGVK